MDGIPYPITPLIPRTEVSIVSNTEVETRENLVSVTYLVDGTVLL